MWLLTDSESPQGTREKEAHLAGPLLCLLATGGSKEIPDVLRNDFA